MASIYKRKNSKFWWIKYRDPASCRLVRESTGLEITCRAQSQKARELCAAATLNELQGARKLKRDGAWDSWVPAFINATHGPRLKTLSQYRICWATLRSWLQCINVHHPLKLTREHVVGYIQWRATGRAGHGKPASRNTAIKELGVMRAIMFEAVLRNYTNSNPCSRLKLRPAPYKQKPEITHDEESRIRNAIAAEPPGAHRDFLEASFEIAIHQGCRISETYIPLSNIDERTGTIRFVQKGGRIHVTLLHPNLVPLVAKWRAQGRTHTYDPSAVCARSMDPLHNLSMLWIVFLKRIGLPHLSFHCTRVTVASRLARAGVHEAKAMRFIGHSSMTVHRIYQRLSLPDLRDCIEPTSSVGEDTLGKS